MKIVGVAVALLGILAIAITPFAYAEGGVAEKEVRGGLRYSITVAEFENRSGWTGQWAIGGTFGAILTNSLKETGRFIVLGETDMREAAMAEQDLGATGRLAEGRKKPRIGYMTPAQLLVKGEITHFQDRVAGGGAGISIGGLRFGVGQDKAEINAVIYVVDSATGQVLASRKVVGEAIRSAIGIGFSDRDWSADIGSFRKTNVGKAVEAAIDQAVEFIVGQLEDIPWTGSVVKVQGDKVFINRGEREGVQKGQTFLVGNSTEIRDPDTGELLHESLEMVGKIEIVAVEDRLSIGSIVGSDEAAAPKSIIERIKGFLRLGAGRSKIQEGMTVRVP